MNMNDFLLIEGNIMLFGLSLVMLYTRNEKGFESKIDPEFLEELWDDDYRSKLTINKLN